jgi:hypothetical protein
MCQREEFEILYKGMLKSADEFTIAFRNQLLLDIAYHT